jgi:hypothetical protein
VTDDLGEQMIRSENPVIVITTYGDFGVYAYDVREAPPRMVLGHDVQDGESVTDAVNAVAEAARARLLEALGVEDE